MTVKIGIYGVNQVINKLIKINKNVENAEKLALNRTCIYIQGEVKASIAGHRKELTSVDTGHFLNKVAWNVTPKQAVVYSNVPYAKFLEYGTSKFKPRRHFENTKARSMGEAIKIFKEEIRKI